MDAKAKGLPLSLLCCGNRTKAKHIKAFEYFQIAKADTTPLPEKKNEWKENVSADFAETIIVAKSLLSWKRN